MKHCQLKKSLDPTVELKRYKHDKLFFSAMINILLVSSQDSKVGKDDIWCNLQCFYSTYPFAAGKGMQRWGRRGRLWLAHPHPRPFHSLPPGSSGASQVLVQLVSIIFRVPSGPTWLSWFINNIYCKWIIELLYMWQPVQYYAKYDPFYLFSAGLHQLSISYLSDIARSLVRIIKMKS